MAASGDAIERVRFRGSTDLLQLEARSLVETRQAVPLLTCFNGLEPSLPYPRGLLNPDLLGALEGWLPNGQHDPSAVELAQDALMGSNQQVLPFLQQLMEMIQEPGQVQPNAMWAQPGQRAGPCGSVWAHAVIWRC